MAEKKNICVNSDVAGIFLATIDNNGDIKVFLYG